MGFISPVQLKGLWYLTRWGAGWERLLCSCGRAGARYGWGLPVSLPRVPRQGCISAGPRPPLALVAGHLRGRHWGGVEIQQGRAALRAHGLGVALLPAEVRGLSGL